MRRPILLAVLSAALLRPASAEAGAVLEGTVALPPAPPAPQAYVRYPGVGPDDVGPPEPPAAVVWVEATGAGERGAPPAMSQHRFQFEPGIVAVSAGGTVRFPNLDDEYHSVFSYSKTKRFDLGRFAKDEGPAEVEFGEPGVVRVYCEIHEHMRGTVVVVDGPFFAKTDAEGRFRIGGLPPGSWTVHAFVADDDVRKQTAELAEGKTTKLDFPAP